MFVPLHDDNTLRVIRFQFVTGAIILLNIAVHLLFTYGDLGVSHLALATSFGLVPAEIGHIDSEISKLQQRKKDLSRLHPTITRNRRK